MFTLFAFALVAAAQQPDFARVDAVLKKNCQGCHAGSKPMAQLRLDSRAAMLKGGMSGAALVPGKSGTSLLMLRVEGKGGQERMPPKMPALAAGDIAVLREWIDAGAVWPGEKAETAIEKHWSYKPPVKATAPTVKDAGRVRNPIDAFLLARLEKQGLGFAPEASRETLLRRASLDLIGLPPTPHELDEFVRDVRPDAYERAVDRLLASPHYGERWARPWLDLARYADTNGYEKDRRRMMWKYRDWVIGALNRDLPFDQFTIEQLAGDMLPNPTVDQRIATGFHRNTMYNEEGGVDREEAHFEVLVDRVNTTGTVWLGTSLGCTQCHNHKYDPLTQKDYYSMMAFFSSALKEEQFYGDTSVKWKEPELELATKEQAAQREKLQGRIREREAQLKAQTPELAAEQAAWEVRLRTAAADWQVLTPERMSSLGGAKLSAVESGAILVSGENPQRETYVLEGRAKSGTLTGVRIEALPHVSLPRGGPGRDVYGNFIFTRVEVEVNGRPVEIAKAEPDDGRLNDKTTKQLWIVDASKEDARLARQLVLVFKKPVETRDGAAVKVTIVQNSDFVGQGVGHFRVSTTAASDPEMVSRLRHNLQVAFHSSERTPAQQKQLSDFYRNMAPSLQAVRDELKELRSEMDKLGVVTALVLGEKPGFERPSDHIRVRGGFASKGDKVYANVPSALPPLPEEALPNRLGLAKWLVARENPLTARVAVNRIWEQYFGRGIVETSEDFGVQGARPEHPELLDWLAVEFMDGQWSMKALHRLIATSSAYRQQSAATADRLQADPLNKLISRGPRFRLEAEMVRDTVLAASGLLSRKVGGPSVFPAQPPGVWDIPYSDDAWKESAGEDKHRRGLYTFARRSAMYPSMMNFDATSREVCTVRRVRTNTPLQALTTLNDEAFFEAAQALGKRMLAEGGVDDAARIAFGYRVTTGHAPSSTEADRIQSWLAGEKQYFAAHVAQARKLTGGDAALAPWTMLGNVLLNLDEALTKE